MELSSIEHLFYGFLSGITEILPVSARAHSIILLKLLGADSVAGLPALLIHLGILAALYSYSRVRLIKMTRARRLSRIPKKKRKRPLDTASLMDSRFLITMMIPVILVLLFMNQVSVLKLSLVSIAGLLIVNGVVLYIPQFLPRSNLDARTLSRVDGLLMGFGAALSVIPGLSGIGTALSIGSVRGIDRSYGLNMTIMLNMVYMVGLIIYDIFNIVTRGFGAVSFPLVVTYILAAAAAFFSTRLGIRIMRVLAEEIGFHFFACYCWGLALLTFFLNLMA